MNLRSALSLAACLLVLPVAQAHEATETVPDPGFRPESRLEAQFVGDVGSATIAVYPTIIRRADRSAVSFSSRARTIAFLSGEGIGQAVASPRRIDRGDMRLPSQWDAFQSGLAVVAEGVAGSAPESDYHLVLEILAPDNQSVFGIECYILDRDGNNAFSFLLNSHHEMFAKAGLTAGNRSEVARERMILAATDVAMEALRAQIEMAGCSDD